MKSIHRPGDPFVFERWTQGDPRLAPIGELPLSVRTLNRLLMDRYWTDHGRARLFAERGVTRPRVAGDLERIRSSHLLLLSGFGRISLLEVEGWLATNEMKLAAETWDEDYDPIVSMSSVVMELERLRASAEQRLGLKLTVFAESGALYLIDDARDRELSDQGGMRRARPYTDGGSIVANLGGTKFSGGGW